MRLTRWESSEGCGPTLICKCLIAKFRRRLKWGKNRFCRREFFLRTFFIVRGGCGRSVSWGIFWYILWPEIGMLFLLGWRLSRTTGRWLPGTAQKYAFLGFLPRKPKYLWKMLHFARPKVCRISSWNRSSDNPTSTIFYLFPATLPLSS